MDYWVQIGTDQENKYNLKMDLKKNTNTNYMETD